MKPNAIYLIRHGESEGNINEGIYKKTPDWKINLTDKGRQQAHEASSQLWTDIAEERVSYYENFANFYPLRPDVAFYSSSFYRAKQTAEIINKTFGAQIYEDPRLREQEWGNYAEDHFVMKIARERKKFGSFYYRMPYGESGADVYDRITTFIDTLHRDFQKDGRDFQRESFPLCAVIVSHGLTIKAFLMRWFHWQAEDFDSYKTPKNCEIIKMKLNTMGKYDLVTPLRKRVK